MSEDQTPVEQPSVPVPQPIPAVQSTGGGVIGPPPAPKDILEELIDGL